MNITQEVEVCVLILAWKKPRDYKIQSRGSLSLVPDLSKLPAPVKGRYGVLWLRKVRGR